MTHKDFPPGQRYRMVCAIFKPKAFTTVLNKIVDNLDKELEEDCVFAPPDHPPLYDDTAATVATDNKHRNVEAKRRELVAEWDCCDAYEILVKQRLEEAHDG